MFIGFFEDFDYVCVVCYIDEINCEIDVFLLWDVSDVDNEDMDE